MIGSCICPSAFCLLVPNLGTEMAANLEEIQLDELACVKWFTRYRIYPSAHHIGFHVKDLLVLNFLIYGTMFSKSNTSARGVSSGPTSAKTATGALKGWSDKAHESLLVSLSLPVVNMTSRRTRLTRVISEILISHSPASFHYSTPCDSQPNARRESHTSCRSCVPSWQAVFVRFR